MTEPDEVPDDTEQDDGAEQLGDAGKRALDAMKAKLKAERATAAELKAKAAKFDELDALTKSDLQREAEARSKAESDLAATRAELMRLRVATAKGLPAEMAARLQGSTEDELSKDADELIKLLRPAAEQRSTSGRAVADLRPAALPAGNSPQSFNADDWIRDRAHRR